MWLSNDNPKSKSDMACSYRIPKILQFFLISSVISCSFSGLVSASVELDEDNWKQILEGEWMVEFYAPWCPACNALAPAWSELSTRAGKKSLAMKAGAVDVTKSPGLSGRFVVTALPTIFHVKDGEFRQYKGPRDADAMLGWVAAGRWKQLDPLPAWKAPHSMQMTLVAQFFKLSQALRSVHTMLMEQYGLPTWGSYLIFAVATIFIGALLGLVLVCIIDLLYPPRRSEKVFISQEEMDRLAQGDENKCDDEKELINDDIVDDNEKDTSEGERNSPSDTSEDEKEAASGDKKSAQSSPRADRGPEVRKRRPRKAD